ncbi:holo-ACP synthase [Brevibacillus humidisoli]|uniref:holo-ACP synthase n=1 Tax=Brevibacillus humidisoli TaxID=2895522 RepID=UPI001E3DBF52|nr:holo-ACP synthase [Brevibacillus humidisoli]UFJ42459.1 holo-ACP synthase [Brevibacillus humidisoli]
MIYGIGVDLQHIGQIGEAIEKHGSAFLVKIFTEEEVAYCQRYPRTHQHLAARWAAKEAFFKALGAGIGQGFLFREVETRNHASGQPYIVLHGNALAHCDRLGLQTHVSLSHSGEYAMAQVLVTIGEQSERSS